MDGRCRGSFDGYSTRSNSIGRTISVGEIMSKLPEWIEEAIDKVGLNRWTVALSLAWEALNTWPVCEARRHCACSNVLAYRKEAMRQIEELGK